MIKNYIMCLNEFRKNLAANVDRSPLIKEPLSKSYGDLWLPARFGIKSRLRRHAVACQEVVPKVGALATPSPNCAGSPVGRALKHASAVLQPSLRTKAISFGLRLASTCFRARIDPIGLVQRFPYYRLIPSRSAAWAGVAGSRPISRMIRTARSTSNTLLANSPLFK